MKLYTKIIPVFLKTIPFGELIEPIYQFDLEHTNISTIVN